MTNVEFRAGRAKVDHFHAEAREARLAHAAGRRRFATWLRGLADRIAAA